MRRPTTPAPGPRPPNTDTHPCALPPDVSGGAERDAGAVGFARVLGDLGATACAA